MSETIGRILAIVLVASVVLVPLFALGWFLVFPKKRTFSWITLTALGLIFVGVGVVSYFDEQPRAVGYIDKAYGLIPPPTEAAGSMRDLYLENTLYFIVTLFAATVAYLFSVQGKLKSSVPALQKLLPSRSDAFYNRLDLLLVIIGGSVIGFVFFNPTTARQALSAGMGWVGAVNILSSGKSGQSVTR
jgi:hypothetical protein